MASFINRSRYHVTVKGRPHLTREFPFSAAAAAQEYFLQLKAEQLEPVLGQYEDAIEVRIRSKGYDEQHITASSYEEAERVAARIEAERRSGLFIDYTKSMRVTYAQLIRRYLIEESPKHKSCEMETYKLNGLLVDSGAEAVAYAEQHPQGGSSAPARRAKGEPMRDTITNIAWLHKPFAQVQPTDIEDWIEDRLQSVSPATVDREIDLLSSITNTAINTWRYPVAISPMKGVRRPKYFNERNRRLIGDEEERLLAAAREEDRIRSVEIRLEALMLDARAEAASLGSASSRKRAIATARKQLLPVAAATYVPIPLYEALVQFLLMTAARRGEALQLTWNHLLLEEQQAFFPRTKNGRPRKVPIRKDLIEVLSSLPRTDDRVFPITADQLRDAWERICERAGISDLHVHDLRHEGISQMAEQRDQFGRSLFSLLDLQTLSGHLCGRMLTRYAHLCVQELATRLDEAFARSRGHKGRRRLGKDSGIAFSQLMSARAPKVDAQFPDNVVPLFRRRP